MRPPKHRFVVWICSSTLVCSGAASAQWSGDPAQSLAVTQAASEQVQPKIAGTPDGGAWISFYDNDPAGSPAFGYDVRLQRIDRAGSPLLGPDGVLVADRAFSSTQDYGLAVDASGMALLAFRDTRFTGTQITADRIQAAGSSLFGPSGVQLTNTTDFVASPRIAATNDGGSVVAWTQGSSVHLMKLGPAGQFLWAQDLILTPAVGSNSLADLEPSTAGGVVVSWVYQSGGFTSPRHLYAQRIDSNGNPLWAPGGMPVFDGGSLQFGNFPSFLPDGNGGAVFGWYSSSPALECRAQRITAAGLELFPHNGTAASIDATKSRTQPALAYDPAERETFLFYLENTNAPFAEGLSAQKFDVAGNRQWTEFGLAIEPLGALDYTSVAAAELADGAQVFWIVQPTFGNAVVRSATVNDAGALVAAPFAVASNPSEKLRLTADRSTVGYARPVWQDNGVGGGDLQAQAVAPSGSLLAAASFSLWNGSGSNPIGYLVATPPAIGTQFDATVTPGANGIQTLTLGFAASSPAIPLPGIGELLLDLTSAQLWQTSVPSSGGLDLHSLFVPATLPLVGVVVAAQALVVNNDLSLQLQNGLLLKIGL